MSEIEVPAAVAARIDSYVTALVDLAMGTPTQTAEDCIAPTAFLALAEAFAAVAIQLGQRQEQLDAARIVPGGDGRLGDHEAGPAEE
ncbi:hypothetical protein [Nocardia sp. NPDC050793]|uniref:hypothetical protein n=1 Tax=Nocardia sp. NPDC050793 TaxID=3155159 RepID=UPI0033C30B9D